MAITWEQYGRMRRKLYWGDAKARMKALPRLPNKAELKALFDRIDSLAELRGLRDTSEIDARLAAASASLVASPSPFTDAIVLDAARVYLKETTPMPEHRGTGRSP